MNKKIKYLALSFSCFCIFAIIALYVYTFGTSFSSEQDIWGAFGDYFGVNGESVGPLSEDIWGAFGDYFGGILNPIFAFFAFLGVLWSVDMQTKQFKRLSLDKQGEEVLAVIKEIDTALGKLLNTLISPAKSTEELYLHHMVSEAERITPIWQSTPAILDSSDSLINFIELANAPGTKIEALVRNLRKQVTTMDKFLDIYSKNLQGNYAPIIDYYKDKNAPAKSLLNLIENLPKNYI